MRFDGTVIATQLSGNESFIHVAVGANRFVCLAHGVHDWAPGVAATVQVVTDGVFVFTDAGQRVRVAAAAPVPVSA